MRIGFYPGCSLEGTAIDYNESLNQVCQAVGIELAEIEDWNCCGATAAHSLNKLLSVALPARILALAEKQDFDEIVVPCAACYSRLLSAYHEIKSDEKLQIKIPEVLEMDYKGTTKPIGMLEFLNKYLFPLIQDKLKNVINLKAACYYGCLLTRPPKLTNIERYEDPLMMENVLKQMGTESIDWSYKTECCGAGLSVSRTEVVARLSGEIIKDAIDRGAEVIIVACPMCQSNLDLRRKEINGYLNQDTNIPVVFITQMLGLAMGIDEKKLGLHRLFVPFKLMNKVVSKAQEQV
jgi:heterodisulfide reductase subunit B2